MDEEIKNRLLNINQCGILRKLMSKDEIKIANILVKDGLMFKGKSDDKQHTVIYYTNF